MSKRCLSYFLPAALVLSAAFGFAVSPARAADGYGAISGQFIYDGEVPERELLVKKGDASVKDASCCAAQNVPSDELVVDEKTKGIQNIFVYLYRPKDVKPDLKESKEKEVVFDQRGCRFIPHALVVRTDQKVRVLSGDPVAHNTHTYPIRGQAVNFLLKANDREGVLVPVPTPESLPTEVKCDIHPWMKAYWLVVDHPYAVVTDEAGRFRIEGIPAGEHEFRVWHERVGYVGTDSYKRGFKVTVRPGETTKVGPIKVAPSKFEE